MDGGGWVSPLQNIGRQKKILHFLNVLNSCTNDIFTNSSLLSPVHFPVLSTSTFVLSCLLSDTLT